MSLSRADTLAPSNKLLGLTSLSGGDAEEFCISQKESKFVELS